MPRAPSATQREDPARRDFLFPKGNLPLRPDSKRHHHRHLPRRPAHTLRSLRSYKQIKIVGNTVFTEEQLSQVTAPYINRRLTSEDMEALRVALTVFYVNQGYINSGAIIPDQEVIDGVLTIQVIEGRLSRIELEGNRLFRAEYLRDRIQPPAGVPLEHPQAAGTAADPPAG